MPAAAQSAPVFNAGSLAASINENSGTARTAAGILVGTVAATDADNDPVTYSIRDGADGEHFGIGATSGQITVKTAINFDYEDKNKYTINVQAADDGGSTADGEFVLNITGIGEPPYFPRAQLHRVAFAGSARAITLEAAVDPENTSVTYALVNGAPVWTSQASVGGKVINIATSATAGLYTLTVSASSAGETIQQEFKLDVLAAPSMSKWKTTDGRKLKWHVANEFCASAGRINQAGGGIWAITLQISYNFGGVLRGYTYNKTFCGTGPSVLRPLLNGPGSGAERVLQVQPNFLNDRVELNPQNQIGGDFVDAPNALKPGTHRYHIFYGAIDCSYPASGQPCGATANKHRFYAKTLNMKYVVADVTTTIPEHTAAANAPDGHKLTTLTLSTQVENAIWAELGSSRVDVDVTALSGSETTKAVIALDGAAALNYEDTTLGAAKVLLTVTVEAATPAPDASGELVQAFSRVVIKLSDVDEPPVFAAATFANRSVGRGGNFNFHAAADPEGESLTYVAHLKDGSSFVALPAYITFNQSSRLFAVTQNAPLGLYTLRVTAAEADDSDANTTEYSANQSFVLMVLPSGIITDTGDLSTLTKASTSSTFELKLSGQPSGGANVTLTLTPANAAQVAVTPNLLTFTPTNWANAQEVTASLSAAGIAIKGARNVIITAAVDSRANSAINYRSVPAVEVTAAVSVANEAPAFAASQAAKSFDENVGAATYPAAQIIATVTATDSDNSSGLIYSLDPVSSIFGINPASGVLTLKAATNLDHESTEFHTLTVAVHDNEPVAIRGSTKQQVIISITDINEPPLLPTLEDHMVLRGTTGSHVPAAAVDPDAGDTLTYSATLSDGGALPAGISFTAATRTFTFASSLAVGQTALRLTAADQAGLQASGDFMLHVTTAGAIMVSTADLRPLSRSDRQSQFAVRLALQPAASAVTLTLRSLDEADVELTPATMVFARADWNQYQQATARLSDDGLIIKSNRQARMSIGVQNRLSSDTYYRGDVQLTVAVAVANTNQAPAFDSDSISGLNIDENVGLAAYAADTPIGSPIVATDVDNEVGDLSYELVGASSLFKVLGSGQVQAAAGANFNHERVSEHELTVAVSDGETTDEGMMQATITVVVNDLNEKPDNYAAHGFAVAGRSRNVVTVTWSNAGFVAQFDEHDRASIVVSYAGGGYSGRVPLPADAQKARLVGLLSGQSYDASLHFYSADGLSQDAGIQLNALMAEDNAAPSLSDQTYAWRENRDDEKTAAGVVIATVVATDPEDDSIRYSIYGGADSWLFAIDAASGRLYLAVAHNFDREQKDVYRIMVAAEDVYGGADTAELAINITDVDELPQLPEQGSFTAKQGVASNFRMLPASEDPENGVLHYEARLDQDDELVALPSWLSLDAGEGEFAVGANAQPGKYSIRVSVTTGLPLVGGLAAAQEEEGEPAPPAMERSFVLVVLEQVSTNTAPDFSGADMNFELAENFVYPAGEVVGTVTAADADSLTYSMRGEDAQPFMIVGSQIRIREEGTSFDREDKQSYQFIVDADDGEALSSAAVEVQITDVNEPPEFMVAPRPVQVFARMQKVFAASAAYDPEGQALTYSFEAPGSWLTFSDSRLQFTVSADAPVGRHEVALLAADSGGETARQEFELHVNAAGNRSPQFVSGRQSVTFELDFDPDMKQIGVLAATDPDGDDLNYRITPSTDAAVFTIDSSGRLEFAEGQQMEAGREYSFVVEVTDGNGGFAIMQVTVKVKGETVSVFAEAAASLLEDRLLLVLADREVAIAAADIIKLQLNRRIGSASSQTARLRQQQLSPYLQMVSAEDQWNNWRRDDHESAIDRLERLEIRDFLYERGFEFALDDDGHRGPQARLWGFGSKSSPFGAPEIEGVVRKYSGSVNLLMFGLEAGVPGRKIGIAGGRSKAKFRFGSESIRVQRKLALVYPYVNFRINEWTRLWATGGFGRGDYITSEADRDASYASVAGGLQGFWDYSDLELSAGVNLLGMQSKLEASQKLQQVEVKAWRAQVDFELARPFSLSSDLSLSPFLGADVSRDGGEDGWLDAKNVDATAGMRLDWRQIMSAEISSYWQINDDVIKREKNFSGSITYDFGSDGRGLLLSVNPDVQQVDDGKVQVSTQGRAGYALPIRLFSASGIATVDARMTHSDSGVSTIYGFRFAGRRLDVDLSAASEEYRLQLNFR